jgi:hypothetical protein
MKEAVKERLGSKVVGERGDIVTEELEERSSAG